jgi:hypothetical protein
MAMNLNDLMLIMKSSLHVAKSSTPGAKVLLRQGGQRRHYNVTHLGVLVRAHAEM